VHVIWKCYCTPSVQYEQHDQNYYGVSLSGIYGFPPDFVSASTYDAVLAFDVYVKSLPGDQRWLRSIAFVNINDVITKRLIMTFKQFFAEQSRENLPSYTLPQTMFNSSGTTHDETGMKAK
jgi:hypothetical protein